MTSRFGIELSPAACRIVEIEGGPSSLEDPQTCVKAFAILPPSGIELRQRLSSLSGRHATVVVWAPGADHRPVVVADAAYERMRHEARAAVRAAGRGAAPVYADITPVARDPAESIVGVGGLRGRRASAGGRDVFPRRTVILALVPVREVYERVEPLIEAGIKVDHVLTPAAALLSLARIHQPRAKKGALEAYVALDDTAASVVLVRDGALVAATGLDWGFAADGADGAEGDALLARGEIADRLASDLTAFLNEGGLSVGDLLHVCIASGLPDLRSLAMTLMERIDVEVEPLDSLFGIDGTRLPADAGVCREHLPALRLAWVAAADRRPAFDLLRPERWRLRRVRLRGLAIATGTAAGLMLGLAIQDRLLPVSSARPMPVLSASTPTGGPEHFPPPMPAAPASRRPLEPSPPRAGSPESSEPSRPVFRPGREPEFAPPRSAVRGEPMPASAPPRPDPPARAAATGRLREEPARPVAATAPLPFEATLESVLIGPGRRVALIDGRVVEPGDVVRSARVVEITATAVLLRDERGRLRRLTAGGVRP